MSLSFIFKAVLALFMIFGGVMHFVKPEIYVRIMPGYLPAPLALVYISGFFEILGGVGLMIPALTPYAAWGLIALFVAIFPANINMAVNQIPFAPGHPAWIAWARLPLQAVLIAWAWAYTKHETL